MLASSVVNGGFEPSSPRYKIYLCCFSDKHAAELERENVGWLGIRTMCQSGGTSLPADCFSELGLSNSNVGLVQSRSISSSH
jgi:hypothetical protein